MFANIKKLTFNKIKAIKSFVLNCSNKEELRLHIPSNMHIIQLTDIHLSVADEKPYDIDVRTNFLKALDIISDLKPDLLVISGDLCYDVGMPEIYNWIKSHLDQLPFPYFLIPGNHDNTPMMIDCFELENTSHNGQLFYRYDEGPQPILFLDTQDYTLPSLQTKWLAEQLEGMTGPVCIFMHHPPTDMQVPYMDQNHALKNSEEVMSILLNYPDTISIFTGHYHVDKSLRKQHLDVHITPSTFFQIDWNSPDFKVDHKRCGFRSIEMSENGIIHSVIYF